MSSHSLSHVYEAYLAHDQEEQNHWQDVCRSFRQYATFAMAQWTSHQYRLQALPASQRSVLPARLRPGTPEFCARALAYKEAAIRNQFCLDCILRHAGQPHSQQTEGSSTPSSSSSVVSPPSTSSTTSAAAEPPLPPPPPSTTTTTASTTPMQHCTDAQMSKVSSVLKSLTRDWSAEGQAERDMAYRPIVQAVQKFLPLLPGQADDPPRLCVPGAGVGRLSCDLASLGYAVQGNEFSLYMLLASDFVLNGGVATPQRPLRISPFLLESRNVRSAADAMRQIAIPDVDPYSLLGVETFSHGPIRTHPVDFSMAGGDFASIYRTKREKGAWDGVVACFFLDTSPCVVEYLQIMYDMLRPGGYLINFGPLLWHWSGPAMRPDDRSIEQYRERYSYLDKKYMESIDLSWQDVHEILLNIGFQLVELKTDGQDALYTADERSLLQMKYRCIHFVAQRPLSSVRSTSGTATAESTTTSAATSTTTAATAPQKPSTQPTAAPTRGAL